MDGSMLIENSNKEDVCTNHNTLHKDTGHTTDRNNHEKWIVEHGVCLADSSKMVPHVPVPPGDKSVTSSMTREESLNALLQNDLEIIQMYSGIVDDDDEEEDSSQESANEENDESNSEGIICCDTDEQGSTINLNSKSFNNNKVHVNDEERIQIYGKGSPGSEILNDRINAASSISNDEDSSICVLPVNENNDMQTNELNINIVNSMIHSSAEINTDNESTESNGTELQQQCWYCQEVFCDNTEFQEHIKSHKELDRNESSSEKDQEPVLNGGTALPFSNLKFLQCWLCTKKFSKSDELQEHVKSHMPNGVELRAQAEQQLTMRMKEIDKVWRCPKCRKNFSSPHDLKRHDRSHFGEKTYECDECGKCYVKIAGYNQHLKVHNGDYNYNCNYCDKRFLRHGDYKRHVLKHTGERPFQCTECGKSFTRNFALIHHWKVVHSNSEIKFANGQLSPGQKICPKCGQNCTNTAGLSRHLMTCTEALKGKEFDKEEKVKQQTIGDQVVSDQLNQQQLIREQQQMWVRMFPRFPCMVPGLNYPAMNGNSFYNQTFAVQASPEAVDKQAAKNKESPKKTHNYHCSICGKGCLSKSDLERHERCHTGEKPHTCRICGKNFALASNLKIHFRTHGSEDPFKCEKCGSLFSKLSVCQQHSKSCSGKLQIEKSSTNNVETHNKTKSPYNEEKTHESVKNATNSANTSDTTRSGLRFCTVCGEFCANDEALAEHMKSHSSNNLLDCEKCGKSCESANALFNHLKTHLDDEQNNELICEICNVPFDSAAKLHKHIRTHSKQRDRVSPGNESPENLSVALDTVIKIEKPDDYFEDTSLTNQNASDIQNQDVLGQVAKLETQDVYLNSYEMSDIDFTENHSHLEDAENRKPLFSCQLCDETCNDAAELSSHLIFHVNKKKLQVKCEKLDPYLAAYNMLSSSNSNNVVNTSDKEFSCTERGLKFNSATLLSEHKSEVHVDVKRASSASIRDVSKFVEYQQDVNSSTETPKLVKKKTESFQCKQCEKVFKSPNRYANHLKNHFTQQFKCNECDEIFENPTKLTTHFKTQHSRSTSYTSKQTDSSTESASKLSAHLIDRSLNRKYKCQDCNLSFYHYQELRVHEFSHKGKKPHECTECGKCFVKNSALYYHKKIHTGEEPYKCKHCPKTFRSSSNLKAHENLHTGLKEYKCEECGKSFRSKSNLSTHRKFHGDTIHKCYICGKGFAVSYNLKVHIRTHTGEKKYKCQLCGNAYSNNDSLKRHMMKHLNG